MDNRLLFRGKRIDNLNKGWVYGHYVSVPRHMIVLTETMQNGSWNCFDIDPATVGQCTGLFAAKSYRGESEQDRLIFEGDIVIMHYFFENCHPETLGVFEDEAEIQGRLEYDELGLTLVDKNGAQYRVSEYIQEPSEELEIISNIYDNPELLDEEGAI